MDDDGKIGLDDFCNDIANQDALSYEDSISISSKGKESYRNTEP